MPAARSTALLLCVSLLLVGLGSCFLLPSGNKSKKARSDGIIPSTGASELAAKLTKDGKLHAPSAEKTSGLRGPSTGSAGPTPPAAAGAPAAPTTPSVVPPRTGGETEERAGGFYNIQRRSAHGAGGTYRGPGDVIPPGSGSGKVLPPSNKHWQRSKKRPHFARVYVGDGNSLELKRMRVTVTIEGARARTVVDHVFYNGANRQLQGTFEYPLPTNASPSYFGMFLTSKQKQMPELFPQAARAALPDLVGVKPATLARKVAKEAWGELREARVVHKEKARRTYEEITRRKVDPALLEYASGNTFRGRVFPIQPNGFNRVILAYEETLDAVGGKLVYRFPLADCPLDQLQTRVEYRGAEVERGELSPAGARSRRLGDVVALEHTWTDKGPGGELLLQLSMGDGRVQAACSNAASGKGSCFHLRVRPDLPVAQNRSYADRAVFLLDTSFSEAPDRFNANLKVLRRILETDSGIRKFNVLCFDVGAAWVDKRGWVRNDAAGRRKVFGKLEQVLLEGATDLSAALELLGSTRWRDSGKPGYLFLLTDGQVNWGRDRSPRALSQALASCNLIKPRVFCYRVGTSAENLTLFRELTRRGGGIFNVFTEAMIEAAAVAHRRRALIIDRVQVPGCHGVLVAGRQASLFPGGEMVVVGRTAKDGPLPSQVVVTGTLDGAPKTLRLPLRFPGPGQLAERAWAEVAVQQMLALEDPSVEPLATAYAQAFNLATRVTSFLVLEKDSDYQQFGIAKEASALKVKDVAQLLAELYARPRSRGSDKGAWTRFLADRKPQDQARRLLALMHELDCRLPPGLHGGALVGRNAAQKGYLDARSKNPRDVRTFVDEAGRRLAKDDTDEAFRVLSTVVENHPGRSDALRLVGYRLLALDQTGEAAQLFDRVRLQRPFEPHSFRDLARALDQSGRYPLAALQYEILLAGEWHDRFGASLKVIAKDEYRRLLDRALHSGRLPTPLLDHLQARHSQLAVGERSAAQLRVTIGWNTDSTDVDLWVVDPNGEPCGYSNRTTASGGQLLDDLTAGYGPERYEAPKVLPGEYVILVHYYALNPALLAGETHVDVLVERYPGTAQAESKRLQIVLNKEGQGVEVCRVRFKAVADAVSPTAKASR